MLYVKTSNFENPNEVICHVINTDYALLAKAPVELGVHVENGLYKIKITRKINNHHNLLSSQIVLINEAKTKDYEVLCLYSDSGITYSITKVDKVEEVELDN